MASKFLRASYTYHIRTSYGVVFQKTIKIKFTNFFSEKSYLIAVFFLSCSTKFAVVRPNTESVFGQARNSEILDSVGTSNTDGPLKLGVSWQTELRRSGGENRRSLLSYRELLTKKPDWSLTASGLPISKSTVLCKGVILRPSRHLPGSNLHD